MQDESKERMKALVSQALALTSIEEFVPALARVMQMICDEAHADGYGTVKKNTHWASKAMAEHLRSLVDHRLVDRSYTELSLREGAPGGDLYEKYGHAMSAVNLSGVVFSLAGDLDEIKRASERDGDRNLAASPIMVCLADKICELAQVE